MASLRSPGLAATGDGGGWRLPAEAGLAPGRLRSGPPPHQFGGRRATNRITQPIGALLHPLFRDRLGAPEQRWERRGQGSTADRRPPRRAARARGRHPHPSSRHRIADATHDAHRAQDVRLRELASLAGVAAAAAALLAVAAATGATRRASPGAWRDGLPIHTVDVPGVTAVNGSWRLPLQATLLGR